MKKLLLVDDDENIRLIVQICLENSWCVIEACSGDEALAVLLQNRPDVILLDLQMPGMNGQATFLKLQESEKTKDIPVIFMSASTHPNEEKELLEMGAQGIISKPFDPLTLSSQIEVILSRFPQYVSHTQIS